MTATASSGQISGTAPMLAQAGDHYATVPDYEFNEYAEPRGRSPARSAGQHQSGGNESRMRRGVLN
jgi:hypothetical protein